MSLRYTKTDLLRSTRVLALLHHSLLLSFSFGSAFCASRPSLSRRLGRGAAQEIATCVRHLRERAEGAKQKIVLMGHSTGCQVSPLFHCLPLSPRC